jgi:hypothetical protein
MAWRLGAGDELGAVGRAEEQGRGSRGAAEEAQQDAIAARQGMRGAEKRESTAGYLKSPRGGAVRR